MAFIFLRTAFLLSTEGRDLKRPSGSTLKCHHKKLNPSVAAVTFVFFWLILSPRSLRNAAIFVKISSALFSGLRMNTMSSAYRTLVCMSSIPLRATFAKTGLATPPWGVPCSGNSGLTPVFRHFHSPVLIAAGAITRAISALWSIRSKVGS